MKVIGELQVVMTYGSRTKTLTLYIAPGNEPYTLLGREWLQHIKLKWKAVVSVTKDPLQQLLYQCALLFNDTLGTMKNYTATLAVKDSAWPKFHRPCLTSASCSS